VKAVEDRALMDFLAEQRIGIESCLTSNIQTSTVATLAQHPLKTFLEHGVLASLNTDDPAVQGVDIIHEYNIAAPQAGLSREQIRQAQINGLEIAFLTPAEKQALKDKVAPVSPLPGGATLARPTKFKLMPDRASRDVWQIQSPAQSAP
jgi:adenosine deaminase